MTTKLIEAFGWGDPGNAHALTDFKVAVDFLGFPDLAMEATGDDELVFRPPRALSKAEAVAWLQGINYAYRWVPICGTLAPPGVDCDCAGGCRTSPDDEQWTALQLEVLTRPWPNG